MTGSPPAQDEDTLFLKNGEHVETAWHAITIAGNAPTAEPLLEAMIEMMPSSRAPDYLQGTTIYLQGGNTRVIKQEIIESLRIVADNLDEESDTSKAARGLLAILTAQ